MSKQIITVCILALHLFTISPLHSTNTTKEAINEDLDDKKTHDETTNEQQNIFTQYVEYLKDLEQKTHANDDVKEAIDVVIEEMLNQSEEHRDQTDTLKNMLTTTQEADEARLHTIENALNALSEKINMVMHNEYAQTAKILKAIEQAQARHETLTVALLVIGLMVTIHFLTKKP